VLTAREHDVLVRLPSLLNLDEIADDMSVSINTVKSHVRSIYDKLGAATRRTAVLAAHEQGILR
jgi:LuxR family maltose regulon positive regulatory protein